MILAGETSNNAGRCLPRSNWATYRDGEENLKMVIQNYFYAVSSHQRPRKPPLTVQTSTMVTIMSISTRHGSRSQTTSMPLSQPQSCAEPDTAVFGCSIKISMTPNAAPHATKRKIVLLRLLFFSLGCLLMAGQKLPHTGAAVENLGEGTFQRVQLRGSGGCC